MPTSACGLQGFSSNIRWQPSATSVRWPVSSLGRLVSLVCVMGRSWELLSSGHYAVCAGGSIGKRGNSIVYDGNFPVFRQIRFRDEAPAHGRLPVGVTGTRKLPTSGVRQNLDQIEQLLHGEFYIQQNALLKVSSTEGWRSVTFGATFFGIHAI